MKVLVVLLNIFLSPIGTLVAGKIVVGLIQLVLMAIAVILIFTGIGAILGFPLALIVWIWGLVVAIQYKPTGDGIQRYG